MSRTPCIRHPKNHPLIKIHRWQIEACDGDVCAAALLSFFEYWHSIKLDMRGKSKQANAIAEMHGETGHQDDTLFQFHSEEELEKGVMIYKRNTIAKSLKLLEKKDFISVHTNPNDRYKFDRTRYFLFHARIVQEWLDIHYADELEAPNSKNQSRSPNNGGSSPKNGARSTDFVAPPSISGASSAKIQASYMKAEITTEISTEEAILIFNSLSEAEQRAIDTEAMEKLAGLGVFGQRPAALNQMRRVILRERREKEQAAPDD